MNDRILFVDDDPNLLAALERNFRKQFSFDTALGGAEALESIRTRGPYAVVLADMNMPGMMGIELLERIRAESPHTVRMMLTGNADQQTAIDAVNRGEVFRFLNKPCPPEVLAPALEVGLKHHEQQRIERELIEGTLAGSIKMLTDVLGMVAPDALGRGQRLRVSMSSFARHLGAEPLWELELGALLSSIGSAVVPAAVLHKAQYSLPLRTEEQAILRRVPQLGHNLLADIPRLTGVALIVLNQHKNFDGSGFPASEVAGEAIPLGSRLLKILLDRLDLETDGVVKQQALDTMAARAGHYDPNLLQECFKCFTNFLATSISSDHPVTSLAVAKLLPGDIVVSDITTKGSLTLVRSGGILTAMTIERLLNFAQIGEVKEPVLIQRKAVDQAA